MRNKKWRTYKMSNEKDSTNIPRYKGRLHLVELYLDSPEWQEAYNRLLEFDNVAYYITMRMVVKSMCTLLLRLIIQHGILVFVKNLV